MSEQDALELKHRRRVAEAAVRAGGRNDLCQMGDGRIASRRDSRTAAEAMRAVIRAAFPLHAIVDRQDSLLDEELQRSLTCCWLIEAPEITPDDRAFPRFGPSATYVIGGRPMAAAVYLRSLDETFSAARGNGAALNGKPLTVATPRPWGRAIVVDGEAPRGQIEEVLSRLAGWRMPSGSRSTLAALCYLATGRIDAFVAPPGSRIQAWDLAAPGLIVEEAGGVIAGGLNLMGSRLVAASNGALLDEVQLRMGTGIA